MVRSVIATTLSVLFVGAFALDMETSPSVAQGQAADTSTAAAGATNPDPANATTDLTDAQLGDLVGRIALYPDDLLALILPASTVPLEVVQAQRFLKEAKGQKTAPKPPESLSEPVRNLLNYPDIIDQMSNDLAWTQKLGEAVYDDQQAVMDAVQRFRMMAYSAGNLKSDDKQKVVVQDQTVTIEPAKPDVIYVPRYEPTTVIYESATPVYSYYPNPYPVYYYPYAPGAAFASGLFWGATAAWAFNWAGGGIGWGNNNVNINRNTNINNINRNGNNINRGGGGSGSWSPKGSGNRPATRPGDAGYRPNTGNRTGAGNRTTAGAGNRPTAGTGNRSGANAGNRSGANAGNRASASGGRGNLSSNTRPATRPSNTTARASSNAGSRPSTSSASRSAGNYSSRGGSQSRAASPRSSSYGGMSGSQSRAASSRGSASRGGGGGGRGGGGRGRGR